VVLPEHLFVQAMTVITPQFHQDEELLKPWIDPHQLKCIDNVWYKGDQVVITEDINGKRHIIQAHHDPLVHGHPEISKTIQIIE
jgi:hypothetical protein